MAVDDATMKGLAAIVAALLATLLVALGRRAAHVSLGAFLGLVALNQFAEAMRALTSGDAADRWARLAAVAAAADPFALYYFAGAFPVRNALGRTRWVALVGGVAALLMAGCIVARPDILGDPFASRLGMAISLYTSVVYAIVFGWALRSSMSGPSGFLVAVSIAALPVFSRLGGDVFAATAVIGLHDTRGYAWILASRLAFFSLGLASFWLLGRRFGIAPRPLARALVWGCAVALVIEVPQFLVSIDDSLAIRPWVVAAGRAGTSIRWLAFGAVMSTVLLRDRFVELRMRERRWAARVLIGLACLAATLIALDLAGAIGGTRGSPIALVALLLLAILLSQGFRDVVDRASLLLYGVPRRVSAAQGPRPLQLGDVVRDRWRLERRLSVGSQGSVFLARDVDDGRPVAVKEIALEPGIATELAANEARVAGMARHPNVVRVLDVVESPERCLVVSAFMPGGSLEARLAREGPLPLAEGAALVEGVLAGLAHVHAQGIVHRDVKPSNVLLDEQGVPRVADFGVTRILRADETRVPGVVGTPKFMAPEQARGENATPASDVYAAALLARACIAGPLPEAFDAVLRRALAPEPAQRWRDAGEMLAAWRSALQVSQ